jgi:predicted phage terminase large subunit-like protein
MPTRLNDPKKSSRVIIMQRSHEGDMVGHIQEKNEQGWEWLVLPAEYDSNRTCVTMLGDIDWRKKDNELLWPERFGKLEIDNLKQELGSYAYSAQFQQRPAPAGGLIFKREWFQYYDLLPDDIESLFISGDLTFKNKKDSDKVSLGVWGVRDANRFLVARINDRLSFTQTCTAIRGLKDDFPSTGAIYIEDAANGPAVIDALHEEISGLIPVSPKELGSKTARAYAVTAQFESRNVFVPHPSQAAWVDEYINELCFFPRAKHDDDVDMTTLALIKAKDPRHGGDAPLISMTKTSYWRDPLTGPMQEEQYQMQETGGGDDWSVGLHRRPNDD